MVAKTNHVGWHPTWIHRHCPGLLHALVIPYTFVVQGRNRLYERGWFAPRRLPKPVISVGNLTVGGTGKTPVVIWLANWLQSRGQRVAILSRGYRRKNSAKHILVSNGRDILSTPAEVGDEPFLMARQCPGVVIAVGRERYEVGHWVLEQGPIDCFILDDGYQHRQLYRNLNLLLIDAMDREGIRAMFPAGRLREPLSAAHRATEILVTRSTPTASGPSMSQVLEDSIGLKVSPIQVIFDSEDVVNIRTNETYPIDRVKGKHALIFSGVGNPSAFHATVKSMGVVIEQELVFPDHYAYSSRDCDEIKKLAQSSNVQCVLTTEKDAVKVESLLDQNDEWCAVRLHTDIGQGKDRLLQLLEKIAV